MHLIQALGFLFIPDDRLDNDKPRIVFCGGGGWSVARSWQPGQVSPVDAGDGTIAPDGSLFGLVRVVRRDMRIAMIPELPDGYYHAYCNLAAMTELSASVDLKRVVARLDLAAPSDDPRQAFYPRALRAV